MSTLTNQRPALSLANYQSSKDNEITDNELLEQEEKSDELADDLTPRKTKAPKLARLRSPSFEGYFASITGAFALQPGNANLKSNAEKIAEIQEHLELMCSLLRECDALKMAVRVESHNSTRKRYFTVVSSEHNHSAIVGIDWTTGEGPTIGLVLPIWSTTIMKLDGDGGFHISRTSTLNHMFKPVSVQTLWSAHQVLEKSIDYAIKHKYFEGVNTNGFLEYYKNLIKSDRESIAEWNELDDLSSHVMNKVNLPPDPDEKVERIKTKVKVTLREVMRNLDLDVVSCSDIRILCEKEMNMNLEKYKRFVNDEVLVVMGQMDTASQIMDYLYLGSEWNATDLVWLKEVGVGYILNITREVDNFFPHNLSYYNIRVYDKETTELLKHWDHTYRFIEKAREAGSKILVHCRHGISRSSSTVIAYLMKQKGWSMSYTLNYVQEIRPIVQPNAGFMKQLLIYEGILNSSRNRFSSLFRQPAVMADENSTKKEKHLEKKKTFEQSRVENMSQSDGVDVSGKNGDIKPEQTDIEMENRQRSISESLEGDDLTSESSKKTWQSPCPQRRLRRAKTMISGAIFIDNEDESDTDSRSSVISTTEASTEGERFTDPDEDALMEQVVIASHMKTELMATVKQLHDDSVEENVFDAVEKSTLEESNMRPSDLRRLSRDSQLMHFKNIASMKKRKSLTEKEMAREIVDKEIPMEYDDTPLLEKSSGCVVEKNKVAKLSELFVRRSRKHIREYARRRTLDDDPFKFAEESSQSCLRTTFPKRENSSVRDQQRDSISLKKEVFSISDQKKNATSPIQEIPEQSLKLQWASKTEKILNQPKTQYPRFRQYGTLRRSATWKSFENRGADNTSKYNSHSNAYSNSISALNLEIQKLSKQPDDLAKNDPEDDVESDPTDEFCVADLVHLHDTYIREKTLQRTARSQSNPTSPVHFKGKTETSHVHHNIKTDSDTYPDSSLLDQATKNNTAVNSKDIILFNSNLKGNKQSTNVKRVQSFPKRNQRVHLNTDSDFNRDFLSMDAIKSMPRSPNLLKKSSDTNINEDLSDCYSKDSAIETRKTTCLPYVKDLIKTYDTRQSSVDEDSTEGSFRERSKSCDARKHYGERNKELLRERSISVHESSLRSPNSIDLRSIDQNQNKMKGKL